MREAIITGYGIFTAFGFGAEALEFSVFAGRSAFTKVSRFNPAPYHAKYAAEYPCFPPPSQVNVLRRCVADALSMAGHDAAGASVLLGFHGDPSDSLRSWSAIATKEQTLNSAAMNGAVSHIPDILADEFGFDRPRLTFANACVSTTNAIAYGTQLINSGTADQVVCGGVHLVTESMFAAFDSGRTLATDGAVRPFSKGRKGLLHGDGAAILILESADHAWKRGATRFGSILGWGQASDARHPDQPHPDGRGLAAAARDALQRAGISPADIGYVNAHGTGTPLGDPAEASALREIFGERVATVPVSSTKSTTGHMLEATGAVEAVITLVALIHGLLPPTAGYLQADPECPIDCIPNASRYARVRHALSLNATLDGANAALVLGIP